MGARSVQPRLSHRLPPLNRGRRYRPLPSLALVAWACGAEPVDQREALESRPQLERTISTQHRTPSRLLLEGPIPTAIVAKEAPPSDPQPAFELDELEMTFVGDVILGRYRDDGYDPIPDGDFELFAEVGPLIGSDLLVGNLETPLIEHLPSHSPIAIQYRFGADANLARHLAFAGFDVMSLANNHAYDLRQAGVEQTPQILRRLGIVAVGAARADVPRFRVETVIRQGRRIGFIALTTRANIPELPGVAPLPLVDVTAIKTVIAPVVEAARAKHDVVIVLAHWGDEYAAQPDWTQRQAAHTLIDAGADLVVGHHPHVLQGIEHYRSGLIAYSLGNFVFENVHEIPRMTGVLRVRYGADGCLAAAIFHPAFIKSIPIKYPAPATGYMGRQVKERIQSLGQQLGTRWYEHGEDLRMEDVDCPARALQAPEPAWTSF